MTDRLEVVEYVNPRNGRTRQCPDAFSRTCKSRCCPRCGNPWAQSWGKKMEIDLSAYQGQVTLISITAPGARDHVRDDGRVIAGVLRWDCGRDHDHGKAGCKVRDADADAWCATLSKRWPKFRDSARKRATREGFTPRLLARVWEPQRRGVPHAHLVMGAEGVDHVAAASYAQALHELAPAYGFGFVDRKCKPISRREAARYVAGYLTGRSKKKGSIRENVSHPRMPISLVWVSPVLTRETGCTMRRFRYVRWFIAWRDNRVPVAPALSGPLLVDIAHLAARIRRRVGRAGDDEDYDANFRQNLADLFEARSLSDRWKWVSYNDPERESWSVRQGLTEWARA